MQKRDIDFARSTIDMIREHRSLSLPHVRMMGNLAIDLSYQRARHLNLFTIDLLFSLL